MSVNTSYTIGERILRTIYYEMAVLKGGFERALIGLYKLFAKCICTKAVFNEQRETRSLASLQNLGATCAFVTPRDLLASIHVMRLSAHDLESRVEALGGAWKKIVPDGEVHSILAIIPGINAGWDAFEGDLLRLKWTKRSVVFEGRTQEVIVTCDNADCIEERDFHKNLFFHANSAGVTFAMLTRRWGFYLGCKQDICAYNPRGVAQSSGIASEAGHYNDIEAVYESVRGSYDPHHIWLTSACGGGAAAAYLKSMHPEITHWIFENGFTRLQDCIDLQSRFARYLASFWMRGLRSLDIPEALKPRETGYNLEAHFEGVIPAPGTMVIARVANDHVLSPAIYDRALTLAGRVHETVHQVVFRSTRPDGNHHIDRYFVHEEAAASMRAIIFA